MQTHLVGQTELNRASGGVALAAGLGLMATWLVAGSTGPTTPMLQFGLVTLALLAAMLCARVTTAATWLACVAILTVSSPWLVGITAGSLALFAILFVMLSASVSGADRQLLRTVAWTIFGFAVYRCILLSTSFGWHASNAVGQGLATVVSHLTGQRTATGATFAGMDLLALMLLFLGALSIRVRRWRDILFWAGGTVVLGHAVYLIVLAMTPFWVHHLPPITVPEFGDPYTPPPFQWSKVGYWVLPWFVPTIGVAIQVAIAVAVARWSAWKPSQTDLPVGLLLTPDRARTRRWLTSYLPMLLAVIVPITATLSPMPLSLKGKTIAAFEPGELDWNVPGYGVYGQESAGMFGLLPVLSQSLGGQFFLTPDLAPEDLRAADVLLVLNPDTTLDDRMRARVWQYVRDGGALLIATQGYYPRPVGPDVVNTLLQPTALVVHRDAAASAMGNWQFSTHRLAHPLSASLPPGMMPVLGDTGASIGVGWFAHPIVVGRWGWSAPQQAAAWDATEYFATTDQLGDLVLVAEQRVGKGRVVVLGDSRVLSNESLVRGWSFGGGLLAYLADGRATPQSAWRQIVTIVGGLLLLSLLLTATGPRQFTTVVLIFIMMTVMCRWANRRAARLVPNGHWIAVDEQIPARGNRLAYIDTSHLGRHSWQDWGFDALNGMALTLMRGDYLPLMMSRMSPAELDQTGLLISIAPSRDFSQRERTMIHDFMARGGVMICIAGAEDARATNRLLADYGIDIPPTPVPPTGDWREPEPMGRVLLPYYRGTRPDGTTYEANVAFFAAWPIHFTGADVEVLVADPRGRPVVVSRSVGRGAVVVIGDTYFAANKNLEYAGGEPFDGRYDNADFWHWLISRLTETQAWSPPPPNLPETPDGADSESEGGV